MFSLNGWLMANREPRGPSLMLAPEFECKSGLTMSIQAGGFHYCEPRNDIGPWKTVEVGFPSRELRTIRKYYEGGGVYARVPIDALERIIKRNGGPA